MKGDDARASFVRRAFLSRESEAEDQKGTRPRLPEEDDHRFEGGRHEVIFRGNCGRLQVYGMSERDVVSPSLGWCYWMYRFPLRFFF